MLRLARRLLCLWLPMGSWDDMPVGGPYALAAGQVFCPGPAADTSGAAGAFAAGVAGQLYAAGAAGGQVTV
jgi:hypothetical protein